MDDKRDEFFLQIKNLFASFNENEESLSDKESFLTKARKALPEYSIPRSAIIMPDGTVIKSLFMDNCPDSEYIQATLIKELRAKFETELAEYEKKTKESRCYSINKDGAIISDSPPMIPFFSYN